MIIDTCICHLDIPTCNAVRINAGYVSLCIIFRYFQNFLIENIFDVISGGIINIIARTHDQIRLFGCQIAQFENRSKNENLIDIKYQIACARANTHVIIQSHCLIDTIFLMYGHILVKINISASGLEKTIINNKTRAAGPKNVYSQEFRNINIDSNDA